MLKYLYAMSTAFIFGAAYALSPPFPGGLLLVRFDPSAEAACPEDGVYAYPPKTVQYFYGNEKKLFRIQTDGTANKVDRIRLNHYRGYGDVYRAAGAVQDHEYACSYLIWFDPSNAHSVATAARDEKLFVGRIVFVRGIWYWARDSAN
jgi:hypothetical protein